MHTDDHSWEHFLEAMHLPEVCWACSSCRMCSQYPPHLAGLQHFRHPRQHEIGGTHRHFFTFQHWMWSHQGHCPESHSVPYASFHSEGLKSCCSPALYCRRLVCVILLVVECVPAEQLFLTAFFKYMWEYDAGRAPADRKLLYIVLEGAHNESAVCLRVYVCGL